MIPYLEKLQKTAQEILAIHQALFMKYPQAFQAELAGFQQYIQYRNERYAHQYSPINGLVFYIVMINELPCFRVFMIENLVADQPGVGSIEVDTSTGSLSYTYDHQGLAQKIEVYENLLMDDLLLECIDLIEFDSWPKEVITQSKKEFEQITVGLEDTLMNLYLDKLKEAWKAVIPEGQLIGILDFLGNTNIRIDQ